MESVNRAYNLLIKENGYDALHVPTASVDGPTPVGAADPEDFQRVVMESQRLANLDPKTERVTPEGKFMYADRDTGEWTTVDRPITRPEMPRYASHGRFRRDTDLFGEIKKKQHEQHQRKVNRTFQKLFVDKYSHSLPYDNPYLVGTAVVIYLVAMFFVYQRALGKRDNLDAKWDYFGEVRDHRVKVRDVYPLFEDECDALVAAAVVVFLAASKATAPDAPFQPALKTDLQAEAPFHLYLLFNAM